MLIKVNYCNNYKNRYILKYMIGQELNLYNGKKFFKVKILKDMVGFKNSEFVFSRKMGKIHNLVKRKGGKGVAKKKT